MAFMKRILDSIPENQKSGLEPTAAHFVEGLATVAAAPTAAHIDFAAVNQAAQGGLIPSESASFQNFGASMDGVNNAGVSGAKAKGGPAVEV